MPAFKNLFFYSGKLLYLLHTYSKVSFHQPRKHLEQEKLYV
jgi:hypothetical protein